MFQKDVLLRWLVLWEAAGIAACWQRQPWSFHQDCECQSQKSTDASGILPNAVWNTECTCSCFYLLLVLWGGNCTSFLTWIPQWPRICVSSNCASVSPVWFSARVCCQALAYEIFMVARWDWPLRKERAVGVRQSEHCVLKQLPRSPSSSFCIRQRTQEEATCTPDTVAVCARLTDAPHDKNNHQKEQTASNSRFFFFWCFEWRKTAKGNTCWRYVGSSAPVRLFT